MDEKALADYLRLFSLDIPIFGLAQCHRQLLIATGAFNERAYLSAARWIGRLVLIVVLVQLGLSVQGAIVGSILASCLEVIVGRYFIQVPIFGKSDFDSRRFWNYAASLSVSGLSMRTFDKLDILMLKLLGGTAAVAGFYGAAQNLSILPGIFALSFSPLLLSTLSRLLKDEDKSFAKEFIKDSIRLTVLLLPFGAIVVSSSQEIVRFFFGDRYIDAAPLLSFLIFSALCVSISSATTAIITASGKPHWTLLLVGPCVPIAIIGHFYLIPRFGALGASMVTTCLSVLLTIISMVVVYRMWHSLPSLATFIRVFIVSAIVYFAGAFWTAQGLYLILKLCILSLLVLGSYLLLREFSAEEIEIGRSFVLNRRRIKPGV
jgi:O-antigen/teichoic acid export membrane protein